MEFNLPFLPWIQLRQMPATLNSTWVQVPLEALIAAFMANLCLQSESDLETMYSFTEKKILIPEKKYWVRKRNSPSFCDSTHAVLGIALILIPELF